MLAEQRQYEILELLNREHIVSVDKLCGMFFASGATIRRDLQKMEREGLIRRTHGGAVLLTGTAAESPLMLRKNEHISEKDLIAEKALPFIQNGQTLFLDSSSTIQQFALKLHSFNGLTVISNGIRTLDALSENSGAQIICTGGRLRPNAKSLVGAGAVKCISGYHADLAVLSCRGVHEVTGVTEANEEEAEIKREYIKNAKRVLLLCDHSKLGGEFFCKICKISDLWQIISDIDLPERYRPI